MSNTITVCEYIYIYTYVYVYVFIYRAMYIEGRNASCERDQRVQHFVHLRGGIWLSCRHFSS